MFYFLHHLMRWVFIALLAAGLYWVWLQREALEPVYVWYDVYENGGLKNNQQLHTVRGRAVAVVDGHTLQVFQDGRSLSVRLTGLRLPHEPLSPSEFKLEKQRRTFLRETVVSREIDVQVTYATPGGMLGIVSLDGTNVNLHFITNGLATFEREYVKNLPRGIQYQFFAADRLREKSLQKEKPLASVSAVESSVAVK